MISVGSVLQNRYRIVRPLAQGGMGAVYEALDERLGHRVAVKQTFFATDQLCKAFEREACLLAELRHSALPKVSDHFLEANGQFLVMEYIPGQDLGRLLEQYGNAIPIETVLHWGEQLFGVLEYLHGHHPPIIHRDLKPANLKLTETGQIVLLDFGLAKGLGSCVSRFGSQDSLVAYTPGYAPLEQIQGKGTDTRSDLFSLAATLYHLLTGVQAPDALTRTLAVMDTETDPLRPAHTLNPGIPLVISTMLTQALALNPQQRPATIGMMHQSWRAGLQSYGIPTGSQFNLALLPSFQPVTDTPSAGPAKILTQAETLCHAVHSKVVEMVERTSVWLQQMVPAEVVPATAPALDLKSQAVTLAALPPISQVSKVEPIQPVRNLMAAVRRPWMWSLMGALVVTIVAGVGVLALTRPATSVPTAGHTAPASPLPVQPDPNDVPAPAKKAEPSPAVGKPAPVNQPAPPPPVSQPAGWEKLPAKPAATETHPPDWKPVAGTKINLETVWVPAGSFTMGGNSPYAQENPAHPVTIRKPFYLGKYEVTQAQWKTVMGTNPSAKTNLNDSSPVDSVSWNEIQEFLKRLNAMNDGFSYRLPTEAEWEYACRAGSATKYFFGNDVRQLKNYAWCNDNSGNRTHPVGQKRPNPWGLYDMLGNVQEWCQDRYHKSYNGAPRDGTAWETQQGENWRIVHGVSWDARPTDAYSSSRGWNYPDRKFPNTGFRIVAVPKN
ncbi:MAG: SUMF1/EgtB/PvdO family nonheme iron enzyme [Blastocatellia bacterium]|nr:SUMF1/EgtB/PvdO family nonheme iron enzyme [Blastocatellia bacterium]